MRILVTGGAGFIGSHLVDAYLKRGDQVAIIDNFVTGLRENVNPKATLYEVDLADNDATAQAVAEFKPELVNHHAAQLSVERSVHDPQFDATTNVLGFLNLMESARRHGLKRVVFASTGGQAYGDSTVFPTPESEPPMPSAPYGVTKAATELYLKFYQREYGIDTVALRYANVYGPRQNPKGETGVIAVFLEKMASGQTPTVNGDGEQTRDYVFIDDVVAANRLASERGSGIYNIGTGKESTVNQIFSLLQAELGTSLEPTRGPARPGEPRRSVLDCSKAQREFDWQPTVSLEEGVRRTVAWYRETYSVS